MKLILTVFGIAAIFVAVWTVLWILGTRRRS